MESWHHASRLSLKKIDALCGWKQMLTKIRSILGSRAICVWSYSAMVIRIEMQAHSVESSIAAHRPIVCVCAWASHTHTKWAKQCDHHRHRRQIICFRLSHLHRTVVAIFGFTPIKQSVRVWNTWWMCALCVRFGTGLMHVCVCVSCIKIDKAPEM